MMLFARSITMRMQTNTLLVGAQLYKATPTHRQVVTLHLVRLQIILQVYGPFVAFKMIFIANCS